jgi:hypothetical protein
MVAMTVVEIVTGHDAAGITRPEVETSSAAIPLEGPIGGSRDRHPGSLFVLVVFEMEIDEASTLGRPLRAPETFLIVGVL